jgi:conjugal transfer pilus assembly protein TraV
MRLRFRFLACAGLAMMASACATFGTNVEGAFQCRAPKGDCAPSHVLDARATSDMTADTNPQDGMRPAMTVAAGDQARTSERTLRIVFPARVDEAGTLHDEAIAWAVIENPRWAAELRRKPGETAAPPLMRQLKRQLKAAQTSVQPKAQTEAQTGAQPGTAVAADRESDVRLEPSDKGAWESEVTVPPDTISDLFPLVSPPVFPSPAGETVAGADAPVAGGFHASASPHDRAPRPSNITSPLLFPSSEAIAAARSEAAASEQQAPQAQPRKEQH